LAQLSLTLPHIAPGRKATSIMVVPIHPTLGGRAPPETASQDEAALRWVDRERVAEHLTDTLVHQMFRASLDLHSALSRVDDDRAARKIRDAIAGLDYAIKDIRIAVFDAPTCATPEQLSSRRVGEAES
jgi:hypothetical protein